MYLYLIIYVARLTRKLLDVFLLDMIAKEKGGNVVILQLQGATHPEMWCSMKHLHGGPQKRRYYQTLIVLNVGPVS